MTNKPCQYIIDKKTDSICGEPSITGIAHPQYDRTLALVCSKHEPRKHSYEAGGCGGHIMSGECYCY